MIVVGLMSGTSCDAVEAAAADFEADEDTLTMRPLGALTHEYPNEMRAELLGAIPPAVIDAAAVGRLDTLLGRALALAAVRLIDEVCPGAAMLVASHGHTLYHWVVDGRVEGTMQIGQPAWIAQRTGLPVVSDFRSRDVSEGGQGAPLLSMFDALTLANVHEGTPESPRPKGASAALNLGGIANITVVGPGVLVAYDTGPANALIDAAAAHFSNGMEPMDRNGERAARGRIDQELLTDLLAHPYFDAAPPKSTGKETFNLDYLLARLDGRSLSPDDVLATVTMLTARTIARELTRHAVTTLVVSGGGAANPSLMRALSECTDDMEIHTTQAWGIPPVAKEAYGFALLGWLTYHGLPGNLPECTGAGAPAVLGTITPGRAGLELPSPAQVAPKRLAIVGRGR
jgi:anhydro-N-acetylmuramic acid kinase